MGLVQRDDVTAWYQPPNQSYDIALEAYNEALKDFNARLKPKTTVAWLKDPSSHEDLQHTVERLRKEHNTTALGDQQKNQWLEKLCSGTMYYSAVFDMLSQCNPEYVALAWGAVKFVLMGIINYAEMTSKFSQAFTEIAEVLPRVSHYARLYGTAFMKDSISRLYSHLMSFLRESVRWYKTSRVRRALKSLANPWELEYKGIVENIRACSDTIRYVAAAATGAETRDIHINVLHLQRNLEAQDMQLRELHTSMARLQDKTDRVLEVVINHKSLSESIRLDVSETKDRVLDIHLSTIIGPLTPSISPQDLLLKNQSLVRRAQAQTFSIQNYGNIGQSLTQWSSVPRSSLFVLQAALGSDKAARSIVLEVISSLRRKDYNVFWNLPHSHSPDQTVSVTEVLKNLVYQALQQNPGYLSRDMESFNSATLIAEHTEREWVSLLGKIIQNLGQCFLVIETQHLFQSYSHSGQWFQHFLNLFQTLVDQSNATVKVLVVSYGSTTPGVTDSNDNRIVSTLPRAIPLPPSKRHLARGRRMPSIRKGI